MVWKNKVNSKKIFSQYKKSLPTFEEGLKTKLDDYDYYSTESVSKEHKKFTVFTKKEKTLLDINKLAKNKNYFEISGVYPSRNHKYLAYGEDLNGRREFSIVVKDIEKNENIEKHQCFSSEALFGIRAQRDIFI